MILVNEGGRTMPYDIECCEDFVALEGLFQSPYLRK